MPTIAVSTYCLGPHCSAVQGVDFALRHGFRGLELGSWTFWPEAMDAHQRRRVRMAAASHDLDLSIHLIHRGVAPASHDSARRARHLAQLEATLELAHDLGARPVVVHPGPVDAPGLAPERVDEGLRREAMGYLADFLASALRRAHETGAVLCLENLPHAPGMVIQSYGELLTLVRQIDDPLLRITLDTGHAALSEGVQQAFDVFGPYLRHIHLHDAGGRRDHYEVGAGSIDFDALRDLLAAFPFTAALEVRDEADPEGSVLRSRRRLVDLLGLSAR